jgi:hypothetical protein
MAETVRLSIHNSAALADSLFTFTAELHHSIL